MFGAAFDNSRLSKCGWVIVFLFAINIVGMMRMGSELPTGQSLAEHLDSRRTSSIDEPISSTSRSLLMEPNNFENAFSLVQPRIMDRSDLLSFRSNHDIDPDSPVIYFVTPTYYRDTQLVDLTRLGQTLLHDATIYWILVEDAEDCTLRLRRLLDRFGLPYAHVAAKTIQGEGRNHRGVEARNRALEVVEQIGVPGVVYFGDDDNAYDIRLFDELRKTQKVGIFGVGLVGGAAYARCLVDKKTGIVNGIASKWQGSGKFSMDMAGFSINTNILFEKRPRFSKDVKPGHLETSFLEQIAGSYDELEPLAHNCTNIFVWHTKTTIRGSMMRNVPGDPDTETLQLLV